jgi:hypothetical protein
MMPQLSHHSTARNSVVDIVDLSGNMMQQISSTQKENGVKKKQKQKLRDIHPLSCFPHAGIVVKNKKKIPEEARALGSVGDRYNNIVDWQICTSRYSGFLWKKISCCDIF